jgi:pSer/pThr/pTyr-binding forkhead associated (FHA) protein
MYKLVIQDDEGKTTVVPLIRDEITIGRKEGNTIRLTERNVSRRHARIHRTNGTVSIEDLDSYNGIIINGSRIQGRANLGEADRVQIGDYLLELKTDRAAEAGEETGGPATQPMERVDPMATTPVPEPMAETASEAATRPIVAAAVPAAVAATPAAGYAAQAPPPATPVQALADTDSGLAGRKSSIARLVVLSSNFAGQEFPLDKPASVIGRTDDNDVVVNHRSISRHHAKIVQEQGRYAVVDLQSSNGVRVNGEEYGKVELRRGDVVDLGHVRLRFVEAGEDFVLGRDAEIVDLAAESAGSKKGLLWAVLALAVVGGGVAVIMTRGGDSGEKAGTVETAKNDRAAVPPGPDDAKAGLGPSDAAGEPSADEPDVAQHLAAARAALDSEQWADMQAAALEALNIDPNNAEAKRLKAQAESELKNEILFGKFQDAARANNWSGIKSAFDRISRDSVYKLRAQSDYDAKKLEYAEAIRVEAKKLADAGECKTLQRMAARAGKIWIEGKQAAMDLMPLCKQNRGDVAVKRDTGKRDTGKGDTGKRDTGKGDTGKRDTGKGDTGKRDTGKGDTGKRDTGPKKSPDDLADEKGQLRPCLQALRGRTGHPIRSPAGAHGVHHRLLQAEEHQARQTPLRPLERLGQTRGQAAVRGLGHQARIEPGARSV